jgi:hypothetical protein
LIQVSNPETVEDRQPYAIVHFVNGLESVFTGSGVTKDDMSFSFVLLSQSELELIVLHGEMKIATIYRCLNDIVRCQRLKGGMLLPMLPTLVVTIVNRFWAGTGGGAGRRRRGTGERDGLQIKLHKASQKWNCVV